MRAVYICSPLSGNMKKNLENVKEYTKTKTLRFLNEKGIVTRDERTRSYTVLAHMETKRSRFIEFDFDRAMKVLQNDESKNIGDELKEVDESDDDLPF